MVAAVTEVRRLEKAEYCGRENCPHRIRNEGPLPPGTPVSRVVKKSSDSVKTSIWVCIDCFQHYEAKHGTYIRMILPPNDQMYTDCVIKGPSACRSERAQTDEQTTSTGSVSSAVLRSKFLDLGSIRKGNSVAQRMRMLSPQIHFHIFTLIVMIFRANATSCGCCI
jgi:hypothetical protein